MTGAASFADRRRLLQLETLYDLALKLHAERQEQELVDELLERVCAVLDPAVAVAMAAADLLLPSARRSTNESARAEAKRGADLDANATSRRWMTGTTIESTLLGHLALV